MVSVVSPLVPVVGIRASVLSRVLVVITAVILLGIVVSESNINLSNFLEKSVPIALDTNCIILMSLVSGPCSIIICARGPSLVLVNLNVVVGSILPPLVSLNVVSNVDSGVIIVHNI